MINKMCKRCKTLAFKLKHENKTCMEIYKGTPYELEAMIGCDEESGQSCCTCFKSKTIESIRGDPCTCSRITAAWGTISPRRDVPFNIFYKKMIGFLRSKWFTNDSWICFEWTHDDSENKGLHCHLWLKKKPLKGSRYNDMIAIKTWEKKGYHKKAMKWYYKCEFSEQDKLDYCKGTTWENEKDKKKQILDKKMRYLLGIENIIYKNGIAGAE